ncbi:hypothetical protein MHYP_G00316170 [Metynnis hypsauchen]
MNEPLSGEFLQIWQFKLRVSHSFIHHLVQTVLGSTTWGFESNILQLAAGGAVELLCPPRHTRLKHHGKCSFTRRLALRHRRAHEAAVVNAYRLQSRHARLFGRIWRRAMTEDLDEEVVFENSPLFQYLQDLGHTDFEACSPISQAQEEELNAQERLLPRDVLLPPRNGGIWRLAEALWSLTPFHQGSAPLRLEQQLDTAFRQYSLRCVLSQDVLLQEDVELIELLDPSALSLGSTNTVCPSATTALPAPYYLSPPSLWDISVLVGLVAVLLAVCVSLWRKAGLQQRVQSQAIQLESLVMNSRALTSLARKSLRLIQETEVISRGFTLLLDRVSAACPFNRAGQLRSQQLIGLRKAAYQSLRCAFRASRLATCIMLKSYPSITDLFFMKNITIHKLGITYQ